MSSFESSCVVFPDAKWMNKSKSIPLGWVYYNLQIFSYAYFPLPPKPKFKNASLNYWGSTNPTPWVSNKSKAAFNYTTYYLGRSHLT